MPTEWLPQATVFARLAFRNHELGFTIVGKDSDLPIDITLNQTARPSHQSRDVSPIKEALHYLAWYRQMNQADSVVMRLAVAILRKRLCQNSF